MSRSLKKGPFIDLHLLEKVEALNRANEMHFVSRGSSSFDMLVPPSLDTSGSKLLMRQPLSLYREAMGRIASSNDMSFWAKMISSEQYSPVAPQEFHRTNCLKPAGLASPGTRP